MLSERKFEKEGLTFDDVLLIPGQSDAVSYTHLDVYKRQVYNSK